jgi:glycerol-3-phosphate dehydrogenase (NAD(P)+)
MKTPLDITVLGAGGWGIALACLLQGNGHRVRMWEFDPGACRRLQEKREEEQKLPGIIIPETVAITNDLPHALSGASILVLAVPSQTVRAAVRSIRKASPYNPGQEPLVVNVAKGLEQKTLMRISEIVAEEWPDLPAGNFAVVSGPSHAEEVSRNIPTTVTVASPDPGTAAAMQKIFNTPYFRVYTNPDLPGVEIGGSLKNVIAIATGISDGLGFGDNTKGALLTRGLHEMVRLGAVLGAKPATFYGLAGLGDLVTTCMSRHSRNRYLGEALGKGEPLASILQRMVMVAEGVATTDSAWALAQKHGLEMPITAATYQVLFKGKSPAEAVKDLMVRELKSEVV